MGTDIHGWVERKVGQKWVSECQLTELGARRDYERFAALAGVRGDGPKPLGAPADIADTTRLSLDGWGVDAHSCSWLSLAEATSIFLKTACGLSQYDQKYPTDAFFGVSVTDRGDEHGRRLVFWFDN